MQSMTKEEWDSVSRERKTKIARAINSFGDGQHPMAGANNLHYFDTTYVINCIMSAVESRK